MHQTREDKVGMVRGIKNEFMQYDSHIDGPVHFFFYCF